MSARRGLLIVFLLVLVVAGLMFATSVMLLRGTGSVTRPTGDVVLVWDLPLTLPEIEPPARAFPVYLSGYSPRRPTVTAMARGIQRAASDARVKGLLLNIEGTAWGWASATEVRDAITAFREKGKPVWASLGMAGEQEYLIATAAETIAMPPTVTLQLDGFAAGAMFFKGTLDKIGASANFERVGKYKSAVEQYTREDMSGPAREMLDVIIDDLYDAFVDSAAVARGMSSDVMRGLVEGGPYLAPRAEELGLIDTLLYATEVEDAATRDGRWETQKLWDYVRALREPGGAPAVALVFASGPIVPGKSFVHPMDGPVVGSETLIEALRDACDRPSVEAIVLRIDSPGGSAQASDDILRELDRCRETKPIVASMSDLAASGGYYIALGADRIVAHRVTQTGSIGIYGGKFNVRGTLEKLGIGVDMIARGPRAEMLSPYRDWTPEERTLFHAQIDAFYQRFIGLVAERREMTIEDADRIGQGRVWTGVAAEELGLVDANGGLEEAIAMARDLAGLEPGARVSLERYPRRKRTFLGQLLEDLLQDEDLEGEGGIASLVQLPPVARAWLAMARLPAGTPLAIMPWSVDAR